MNQKIVSPLGEISVMLDGKEIPYKVRTVLPDPQVYPDISACYRVRVSVVPDGKCHQVACILKKASELKSFPDSGEMYVCREFFGEKHLLAIGMYDDDDAYVLAGLRTKKYESISFEQGVEYRLSPASELTDCVFGVAWIDLSLPPNTTGVELRLQPWFAADPTYRDTVYQDGEES